jgi:hypothetical protein
VSFHLSVFLLAHQPGGSQYKISHASTKGKTSTKNAEKSGLIVNKSDKTKVWIYKALSV